MQFTAQPAAAAGRGGHPHRARGDAGLAQDAVPRPGRRASWLSSPAEMSDQPATHGEERRRPRRCRDAGRERRRREAVVRGVPADRPRRRRNRRPPDPAARSERGTGLLDRISGLRRDLARSNGLWVPPIRVRDNIQLEPEAYRFLINGREVARGKVQPEPVAGDRAPARRPSPLEGEADAGAGVRPAREVDRRASDGPGGVGRLHRRRRPSVMITHLGEMVRRHAAELLGREDLKTWWTRSAKRRRAWWTS